MIANGLVDEVKHILELGYNESLQSLQTVGYQEVFDYLRGDCKKYEMTGLIKQRTRNYAKRQITWYKRDNRVDWFMTSDKSSLFGIADKIEKKLIKMGI